MAFKEKQKKHWHQTLDFSLIPSRVISAEEVLEILEKDPTEIKNINFYPSRLGQKGFGKFEIKWKTSHYEMVS